MDHCLFMSTISTTPPLAHVFPCDTTFLYRPILPGTRTAPIRLTRFNESGSRNCIDSNYRTGYRFESTIRFMQGPMHIMLVILYCATPIRGHFRRLSIVYSRRQSSLALPTRHSHVEVNLEVFHQTLYLQEGESYHILRARLGSCASVGF